MTEIIVDNNNTGEITALKVYELAADVGKECQQLIEKYGQESTSSVTLKIISILEHLELLVNEKIELQKTVVKLNEDVVDCQNELQRKTEESLLFQTDVQKLENQHMEDLDEWKELLSKARKENRELKKQLNEKEGEVIQEKVQEQETMRVLLKLKETVDRQRDELRARDSELRTKNQDVEALQQQVDRLAKVNSNLRRKQEVVENHSRDLIREKSHLQVDVMVLNRDLSHQKTLADIDETDGEVKGQTEVDTNKNEEGKVVIDLSDPERPRFTLHELRTVLQERDEMHLKVVALEEELEAYRSEEDQADGSANESSMKEEETRKEKPSGIRKFFGNLFKGSKEKIDVEEELKKWELLDLESSDLCPAETDPHLLLPTDGAVTSESPASSQSTPPRRHSDASPGRVYDGAPLNASGTKSEGWFAGLKKSFSPSKEMVEMTSPSSRSRSSSLQDMPSPRSTPPPLRLKICGDGNDGEEVEAVSQNGALGEASQNGVVGEVSQNVTVGEVSQNEAVGEVSQNGAVGEVSQNGTVGEVSQDGAVGQVSQNGTVGEVSQNGTVSSMHEFDTEHFK